MRRFLVIAAGMVLTAASVSAVAGPKQDVARIRAAMSALGAQYTPDTVEPSPVPGIYQATVGARVVYVSADGRYLFDGNLVDLKQRTSLTEPVRRQLRTQKINAVGEKNMLIYAPAHPKYVVTVFTDIDCPYCRRLHSQMAEYNRLGIEIRYLFLPRAGIGSSSYEKAVSVWCASDRHRAMDEAKRGAHLPRRQCRNPVRGHFELAQELGFGATPTLVTDTGEVHPGYLAPQALLNLLERQSERLGPRRTKG